MEKAMLSQPMGGMAQEEIAETRERAITALEAMGYEVVNTLFTDDWYAPYAMKKNGVENIPLCFLAKSLEIMSKCHAAYFCKGWEDARGCRIEHAAAKAYGLKIIYEEEKDKSASIMQRHIGVKLVDACPMERNGQAGYCVIYEGGYESWSPRDVFERAYFPISRPDMLTDADIRAFMAAGDRHVETRGEKTTLVEMRFPTGFVDIEASSCVDPANYDQELGEKICLEKITDRLWRNMGFVLQWARQGLRR